MGQIQIVISGMPQEGGYLRAGSFIDSLSSFMAGVYKTAKLATRSGSPSFFFRIIDLSTNSPASVVLEAVPYDTDNDGFSSALNTWFSIAKAINLTEGHPEPIEYEILESFSALTKNIGRYVSSIGIKSNGNEFLVDNKFKTKVGLFLSKEERSHGFVQGMLEYINIHDRNVFKIYPDVGPTKLTCNFPESLRERAKAALGNYVEVRGELVFKASARFPHEITVEEIDVFPPEETLMSFDEMQTFYMGLDRAK